MYDPYSTTSTTQFNVHTGNAKATLMTPLRAAEFNRAPVALRADFPLKWPGVRAATAKGRRIYQHILLRMEEYIGVPLCGLIGNMLMVVSSTPDTLD